MEKAFGTVISIVLVVVVVLGTLAFLAKNKDNAEHIAEPLNDFQCKLESGTCVAEGSCPSGGAISDVECGEGFVCCREQVA